MIPNNSLTWKEWFALAEHLATNLETIGHEPPDNVRYVRASFPELQAVAFSNLSSPALIADAPDSEGIDNSSNNLLARRYLAWTIVKRLGDNNGYADIIDAELECETIALSVLARLRAERIHKGGKVFADVQMDAWEGDGITPFLNNGWAGYRIMVPVQVSDQRLKYDPTLWTDGVGSWTYSDLTGLSCAALNHPTLGLSDAQRLGCILPQYDFSLEATQDAVTAQQILDLEEWLGTGGGPGSPVSVSLNGTLIGTPAAGTNVNYLVKRGGVQVGSLVGGEWIVEECVVDPLVVVLNGNESDVISTVTNPSGAALNIDVRNSADVPVGAAGVDRVDVGDVIIKQSEGQPDITVGQAAAESVYYLPGTRVRYELDDGGLTFTDAYPTLSATPDLLVSETIPARDLLDEADNVVGGRKVTLADLLNNTLPQCPVTETPSLCEQISDGSVVDIAACVTASGKRAGVLEELIPTVDEVDTVAQVFDVMTPAQKELFDVTIQLVDSAAGNIGAPDVYTPGTSTTKTAPNGDVTLEGVPISSVLSGGTDALDKTDLVDAVKVSGATEPQKNAVYKDNGVVNGRTSYAALPNHTIEWNGTQYDLVDIFTGIDWQTTNAPANPWSGTWVELPGATPIVGTVAQATIQDLCAEDATVYATDGTTVVATVAPGGDTSLPQTRVPYEDAAGASQYTTPSDTEFSGGTLNPVDEIPRREMLVTGGAGTGKYASVGDLLANTLPTIPQLVFATWAAGAGDTIGVVFPSSMQGVAFSFVSETVSNGTITVSVNNGSSFASAPFTASTSKVIFRRTTTTSESTATYTTA
jgi:hypothetical protein